MANVLDIMKKLNKDYKNENLCGLASKIVDYEPILWPSPSANYPLYKGLPRGRFTQISGLESSGKTLLASTLIAEEQRLSKVKGSVNFGKKCVFLDVEHTYDKRWAQTLGVNLDELIYIDPLNMSGEEALTVALELLNADDVSLMVLDSFAAMMTQEEFEDQDVVKASFKSMAKPIGKFLRIATSVIAEKGIALIGINQLRTNIGNQYVPYIVPGGKALDFFTSVHIQCGSRKFIDENGNEMSGQTPVDPAGIRVRFKVLKNKTTPNNRHTGFMTVRFRTGVDALNDTIEVAKLIGVIEQGGAWFTLIDPDTGVVVANPASNNGKFQGLNNVKKYFMDNPQLFHKYRDAVNEKISVWEELNGTPKLVAEEEGDFIDTNKIANMDEKDPMDY